MDVAVVTCIAAALAAAIHVYIFVMETLRWEQPATRRVFGTTAEQAAVTKQLAANQGVYNLLLGIAALVGVVLIGVGVREAGLAVTVSATAIMLGAATYLVATDATKVRAAAVQGAFPLIAVLTGVVAIVSAGS